MTLFFAFLHPAWAAGEEVAGGKDKSPAPAAHDSTSKSDDVATTTAPDDSASKPDGVKDLVGKPEDKTITDPLYGKWWFWAVAIVVAGGLTALAVLPMKKAAAGCPANYQLGCIGDGR